MKKCSSCQEEKPLSGFYNTTRSPGKRHICKDCERARNKEYRMAHPERLQGNRAIIAEKKSVPCTDCGISYPWYVMDFDHARGDKVTNIGKMYNVAESVLLAEIEKCDVVCANCHRERTHSRRLDIFPNVMYNAIDGERGVR